MIILQEFSVTHCDLWFMKLGVCTPLNIFALGNRQGRVRNIFIWVSFCLMTVYNCHSHYGCTFTVIFLRCTDTALYWIVLSVTTLYLLSWTLLSPSLHSHIIITALHNIVLYYHQFNHWTCFALLSSLSLSLLLSSPPSVSPSRPLHCRFASIP